MRIPLLLFLLWVSTACKDEIYSGKVVKISDGDTFILLSPEKKQIKVRLYGIDAPEKNQDFGNVSRQNLGKLLMDKVVKVTSKGKDQYGRIIGIVVADGVNVNEAQLSSGMAWHFKKYDSNPVWDSLERKAREKKIGLWYQPKPEPPWTWRKTKKRKTTEKI